MNGLGGFTEPNDLFGNALASGDFNGDSYSDLAVGAPGQIAYEGEFLFNDSRDCAGAVIVIYGSASGLSTTAIEEQFWSQANSDVEGTAEGNEGAECDNFGRPLAAGDFNNDGEDDLAVGVPLEDLADINDNVLIDAGAINVIYGSSGGLSRDRYPGRSMAPE